MAITIKKFRVRLDIDWKTLRTPDALEGAEASGTLSDIHNIPNGTGNGCINQLYSARRTVAATANDDLDLMGILANTYGEVISYLTIRGIYVRNTSANAVTRILVSNTGTTLTTLPWIVPVSAGGLFVAEDFYSGEGVIASTGDLLRMTNADAVNAATYEIVLVGTSS